MPFRPNDFKAEPKPEEFAGPQMKGVAGPGGLPGFHTTTDLDTAITYAYAKVRGLIGDLDDPIDDYPVVVTLDMAGLQAEPDWDAEVIVRGDLEEIATRILRDDAPETPAEVWRALEGWLEDSESRPAPPNVDEYLEEHLVIAHATSRLRDLLEDVEDPVALLREIAAGKIQPDLLSRITGQFRYTTDISSDRIVAVTYVRPYWPTIIGEVPDELTADEDAEVEQIEGAGFTVVTLDDTHNFEMVSDLKDAWERRGRQQRLFGEPERLEYHGTTFRNLRRAAPDVPLPDPPKPFDPSLADE